MIIFLRKIFARSLVLKSETSTKVCFHKKIWEEQLGFMVDWKNCRNFATPPLGSQQNDVWADKLRNTMRENLGTRLKYHTDDLRGAAD